MNAKPLPAIIATAAGALLSTLCHPGAASPLLTLHEGSKWIRATGRPNP